MKRQPEVTKNHEPLDLKAIEVRLEPYRCEHGGFHNEIHGYTSVLLTILRETREVLRTARTILNNAHLSNRVLEIDVVLAKVRDK